VSFSPEKLDNICCPQHRETKADTLKANEAKEKKEEKKTRN
jgi:hypothetical protein